MEKNGMEAFFFALKKANLGLVQHNQSFDDVNNSVGFMALYLCLSVQEKNWTAFNLTKKK